MKLPKVTIKLNPDEELEDVMAELIHISVNSFIASREWQEQHGSALLGRKKYWESRMEEFIFKYGIERTIKPFQIKIETQNNQE